LPLRGEKPLKVLLAKKTGRFYGGRRARGAPELDIWEWHPCVTGEWPYSRKLRKRGGVGTGGRSPAGRGSLEKRRRNPFGGEKRSPVCRKLVRFSRVIEGLPSRRNKKGGKAPSPLVKETKKSLFPKRRRRGHFLERRQKNGLLLKEGGTSGGRYSFGWGSICRSEKEGGGFGLEKTL